MSLKCRSMGLFRRRNPKSLGDEGEALAATYLKRLGYVLVAQNYRGAGGELDIICRDGDTMVFVEVKTRSSSRYGGAAWAVPPAKRQQVAKVARHYLVANDLDGQVPCRFDVVLVDAASEPYQVTHIPAAF